MSQLSSALYSVLNSLGCDEELVKKNQRAIKVRSMWAEIVEDFFLDHTNSVFIIRENEKKVLIVYVDESIFAAELNGRRELIKLKFLEKFDEEIDEFKICISRGAYKKNYPYKEEVNPAYVEEARPAALSNSEIETLYEQTKSIQSNEVRNSLLKAMVADLEWKKGINEKNTQNDKS